VRDIIQDDQLNTNFLLIQLIFSRIGFYEFGIIDYLLRPFLYKTNHINQTRFRRPISWREFVTINSNKFMTWRDLCCYIVDWEGSFRKSVSIIWMKLHERQLFQEGTTWMLYFKINTWNELNGIRRRVPGHRLHHNSISIKTIGPFRSRIDSY